MTIKVYVFIVVRCEKMYIIWDFELFYLYVGFNETSLTEEKMITLIYSEIVNRIYNYRL